MAAAASSPPTSFPMPQGRSLLPEQDRRPPSSNGSAEISPELNQAEVARQLESMMAEVKDQLYEERMKTESAVAEARQLRQQLEHQEARVNQRCPDGDPLVLPPGLAVPPGDGSGVCAGVPTSHLLPGPTMQGLPQLRDKVPDVEVEEGGQGSGVPPGVDSGVYGAGVSGVPASHLLPGPVPKASMQQPRQRSQPPSCPKAFLQGLFGLGGVPRQESSARPQVPMPKSTAKPPHPTASGQLDCTTSTTTATCA